MAGITLNDRQKGAQVRNLILDEVIRVFKLQKLSKADAALKKELLLRMATNVLPRITEITGEDGGAIVVQIAKEVAEKNDVIETPNVPDTSTEPNSNQQSEISGS